jgi:transposase
VPTLQPSTSRYPRTTIKPARCPKCRSTMVPASVMPGLSEFSHRIFQCSKCEHVQIMPADRD